MFVHTWHGDRLSSLPIEMANSRWQFDADVATAKWTSFTQLKLQKTNFYCAVFLNPLEIFLMTRNILQAVEIKDFSSNWSGFFYCGWRSRRRACFWRQNTAKRAKIVNPTKFIKLMEKVCPDLILFYYLFKMTIL